uniref:M15 family metallopeptidase n=1 Tax=Fodinibius sp. TaxID=1872440 RepID=UPI0035656002
IWERKWNNSTAESDLDKALEILEYSSMPMTSRHHWGTDIDLNDLNNSYFESGQGRKEYEWLRAHANDFGFYQPYTDKSLNGRTGYNEEKWHWSYLPLASQYLKFYNRNISNADITGFKGSELAKEIDMVNNYVNGISATIKQESE